MLSTIEARRTRSKSVVSSSPLATSELNILNDLCTNLHSPVQFINVYNQCYQITHLRSSLIEVLCTILANSVNVVTEIILFILDCFITNSNSLLTELTNIQFKQNLLPFIKHTLLINEDNNDQLLSILKFLNELIKNHSNLLNSTLTDWILSLLRFVVTRITTSTYTIFGDLIIDLLSNIVKCFTPLPKEIVDILGRSSSIISTSFINELKKWIKRIDNTKLALFAIHLWEPLASLLSRLLTRGYTKGNEMLAVIQDGRHIS